MMATKNLFSVQSRSCDSLSRPLNRPTQKQVRLPISKSSSTKRLIERGCIDDSNYIKFDEEQHYNLRNINLRLHQTNGDYQNGDDIENKHRQPQKIIKNEKSDVSNHKDRG